MWLHGPSSSPRNVKRNWHGFMWKIFLTKQKDHFFVWVPPSFSYHLECCNMKCSSSHSVTISSLQFSRSVVPDSLQPHESQHARLPCRSLTPGVHSESRPSSQWSHPAISSSVVPFSSKGLSRVFSNTTVQKHQFFGAQPSSQSTSHIHTWLLEKP